MPNPNFCLIFAYIFKTTKKKNYKMNTMINIFEFNFEAAEADFSLGRSSYVNS